MRQALCLRTILQLADDSVTRLAAASPRSRAQTLAAVDAAVLDAGSERALL